ncbi:response regulator transcription factor [Streptosporangium sp. NBC_01639]|uniref:response regulator transcription factor n=1 Tax=unclassified Streptosporangium TaxID=2632669 RepID=UPI002DDBB806|nr:response regulator transcription factor [Streptosporangium sp. NBC_01756]WSC84346.1 response regulator transcription factor [Streptosporangium sp. NBC_01756]WTD57028.1 response regulator transcription factor [Streptosporangium sp. NBC_01639]
MVRVVLADDEAVVRAGVRAILSADPEIEVVAEAADGRILVELVRAHRPDVALVDIRMPELDGLAAVPELRRVAPGTAVLIMTTFGADAHIARALGDGAAGFLLKTGDPREFLLGVRAVADGAAYLSPRVAARVIDELTGDRLGRRTVALDRIGVLTKREREVLGLVGAGLSNAEIARSLHLVEGSVKTYVSTILGRLGVRNRVQAAVLAHEAGLAVRP